MIEPPLTGATVVVTRPQPEADELGQRLSALGYHVIINPVLAFKSVPFDVTLFDGIEVLAVTSARVATGLSRLLASENVTPQIPVVAVGAATARAVGSLGFTSVRDAAGDASDLARLLCQDYSGQSIGYLHGVETARDLEAVTATICQQAGKAAPSFISAVCYEMEDVRFLDSGFSDPFRTFHVLLLSPRTARCFRTSIEGAADGRALMSAIHLYGLSDAILDAAGSGWASKTASRAPNLDSLLEKLPPAGKDRSGSQS